MSLPLRFGTTLGPIPSGTALHVTANLRVLWEPRLHTGKFKMGLVCAGDPRPYMSDANATDRRRSLHALAFEPLLKIAGVTFASLQFGAQTRSQITEIDSRYLPSDPMGEVSDFADTATIASCLDLLVAVDTSIVPLASALNIPISVLSRFDGCWRWLADRDDSPRYPTVRLFRQSRPGDCHDVINRVADALVMDAERFDPGDPRAVRPRSSPSTARR